MSVTKSWAAVLVAYGYDRSTTDRWANFCDRLGIDPANRLVIDNAGQVGGADLAGTNAHYEFSGYLEGLRELRTRTGGDSAARYTRVIVVNDTLFSHHWVGGWARILGSKPDSEGIWGDPRRDLVEGLAEPLEFLASWVFDLAGPHAVAALERALVDVIERFDDVDGRPAYERHLERYIQGTRWRGYSDPAVVVDPADRHRKLACIRAEHRISSHPDVEPLVRTRTGAQYRFVHIVDRLMSARRRIASRQRLG